MELRDRITLIIIFVPVALCLYFLILRMIKQLSERHLIDRKVNGSFKQRGILITTVLILTTAILAAIIILIFYFPEILPLSKFWRTIIPFIIVPLWFIPIGLIHALGKVAGESGKSASWLLTEFSNMFEKAPSNKRNDKHNKSFESDA